MEHAVALPALDGHGPGPGPEEEYTTTGIPHDKMGMWVFLCSEVMFFTGLIGSYIVLRFATPLWPVPGTVLNIPLTAFNTFILICSSVTMVQALAAVIKQEQPALVLCGRQAIDDDMGAVGAQLAEVLDWPCASWIMEAAVDEAVRRLGPALGPEEVGKHIADLAALSLDLRTGPQHSRMLNRGRDHVLALTRTHRA